MIAKRITGQQLAQNINSEVILLGKINKISSTGKGVELLTTDHIPVNVTLPEAIDGNCEGYMEVHGTAMSKSTVSCNLFVHFPPEISDSFDSEKYNSFLLTLHVIGDKKWKYDAEQEVF